MTLFICAEHNTARVNPAIMKLILTLFAPSALLCGYSDAAPLKVFILAGQSNMRGHAKTSTLEPRYP
jgi:hypothetical protein